MNQAPGRSWRTLLVMAMMMIGFTMMTDVQGNFQRRKPALVEGDILIGALFSIHHQPKQKRVFTLSCGEIREQYGIQRVEAAFLAIDEINASNKLLPNITLGVEIRDSCWYSSIALEQSIEFIRDALASPGSGSNTSDSGACRTSPAVTKHLVGVVGPGSSDVTIQVQNLLQLFGIPQVGYSATSRDLSDKSRFSYFLRVVPSDYYQAQVLLDIVRHYNWTYVSAVHTDGNYGQSGIAAFRELAEKTNICIAKEDSVLSNAEDEAFDKVIRQLMEDQRANVVVCFCEGMTVRHLLLAAQRNNVTSRFLFLGSDGWADRSDVVAGLQEAAVGGLSIKIQSSYVTQFDDHYFRLRPDNNPRNPWFREFWQIRFNCSLPGSEEIPNLPRCTGAESLRKGYKQDTKMAFVMKALYTMAWGLHNMQQDLCRDQTGLCESMLPINGSLYRDYLMNVTFSFLNETVTFDSRGDPPGRYSIMNYQKLDNGSWDYVQVGTWDNGTLVVQEDHVYFKTTDRQPPISVCSEPCNYNEYKSFVETGDDTQQCCWICTPCDQDEFLRNETTCERCSPGYWPNRNKTGCDAIPAKHLQWDDEESIAALCLASLGMLATLFTMAVFIRYNDTPVVKASTRELSYIIFVGMMVSYCATLPLLARPSSVSCAASRIMPGLSFAMIYAALVTKTNRIARILAGTKKIMMRKHRFMSATAQVVITCILISIEVGIITTMLILDRPGVKHNFPHLGEVKLVCNTTPRGIMAPMGWDFFLIAMCTVYAIKTRNLPENFNEAKFIGFSMYTTCVIWMAWVPIYFGSDHKIICMSMCTSLSALVTLVLLFFPKLYIILLRPEKNDRAAFKTATTVRCHIGSANKASLSRSSDRTPSAAIESMYVGSAMLGIAQPQLSLMQRIRSTLGMGMPFLPPGIGILPRDPNARALLRREISVWSDASGSAGAGGQAANNHARDMMLKKAYGSQLDLAGLWSHEERSCQTTDDLLDPLIPRLRRRVARAVRENEMDQAEGREFFNITQSWMSSQAEAARSAMSRNDSQRSSEAEERPKSTTIIRDNIIEEKKEGCEYTQQHMKFAQRRNKPDKSENNGTNHESDSIEKAKNINTDSENERDGKKQNDNIASSTTDCQSSKDESKDIVTEKSDAPESHELKSDSETKISATDINDQCNQNHRSQNNDCDSLKPNGCIKDSTKSCLDNHIEITPQRTNSQTQAFIGYGSVLPCDSSWKRQRSVSCDNSMVYKSSLSPSDQSTLCENYAQKIGWMSTSDSGATLAASDKGDQSDFPFRKRKVGVMSKATDVRGILKSTNVSPSEKDFRVTFNSDISSTHTCIRGDYDQTSPASSSSSDDPDTDCPGGNQQYMYQKISYGSCNSLQKHSISEETPYRILEEAMSVESDLDISDNCELKTIIISLGCDDESGNISSEGKAEKHYTTSINWRPKLGRNHQLLSYTTGAYSYDNSIATLDSKTMLSSQDQYSLKPFPVPSETGLSQCGQAQAASASSPRYASENELFILDLLHNTMMPKQLPSNESQSHLTSKTSNSSNSQGMTSNISKLQKDSSQESLKNVTISPPERYRNSPPVQSSPTSTLGHNIVHDHQHKSTSFQSKHILSIPISEKPEEEHKNSFSAASQDQEDTNTTPSTQHTIIHSKENYELCQIPSAEHTVQQQELPASTYQYPSVPMQSQHKSSDAHPPLNSSKNNNTQRQRNDNKLGELGRQTKIRIFKPETDDDTDESSTTPIEEFFRTRGIKFDVTSTKSKKL